MKFLKIFALTTLVSFYASALGFGLEGGFRQQSGDTVPGATTTSQVGYTLGALGYFDMTERFAFRSGVFYTQRPLQVTNDITKTSSTISLTYFDIPLGVMVKFADWMGAYIGTAVSVNLDKTSSNTGAFTLTEVKSIVTPLQLGVTFKFMPELGLDLYFESFGDPALGLKSYRAVGVNLLFTME